jgi:hypothetical protein
LKWPGLFPAVFFCSQTGTRNDAGTKKSHAPANFFIIVVDATFTISVERLFTKPFEAIPPTATFPCVYRACNPD